MKELKITVKFNVNFLSMVLKCTLYLAMCVFFFKKAIDFTIYFYYNENVGSPFFVKFSFQNQFAGGFS